MRSRPGSRIARLLLLLTLTGCAASGVPDTKLELPPVPSELRTCFEKIVPPPARGPLTKRQIFRLIADLKASADDKDACGQRLVAWYEDFAREMGR